MPRPGRQIGVGNRTGAREAGAAAEGLIGVYDGGQLLLFGFDQDHSRVHEVTLGQKHFHVFDAGILKKFAGGFDGGLERFQLLLLDLDALARSSPPWTCG